ncbi:MAG: 50S ribosomal protein L25 [Candidatus Peribacteria bacterium]|nr:MAG: 50S ribosomal protein L25 [Candidatus Peribacteria bacterium]
METLTLNAEMRSKDERAKDLLAVRQVAGVVYGHKQEAISVKVDASDLLKTYRIAGEGHIISLNVDKKKIDVMVHDVQRHPVTGEFTHIDFYAITKGEKVTAKIHLEFTGVSAAVKEGAMLEEHLKELEVRCLPTDLVDSFNVDLSLLKETGDSIKVADLAIDTSKYDIMHGEDEVVASANQLRAQADTEETEEATPSEETEEAK